MSLTLQTICTNKNPSSAPAPAPARAPPIPSIHFLNPRIPLISTPNSRTTSFPIYRFSISQFSVREKITASFDQPFRTWASKGPNYGESYSFIIDDFLSIIEFLCLVSSAAVSLYVAVNHGVPKLGVLGGRILVWQSVVLVSGAAIGAVIRRRQWRRICGGGSSRGQDSRGADLSGRVEKLEENLRSTATVIRVLTRQLEKLGIRVQGTRKSLKDPIAETAALAQKNSEVTRALAAQEEILGKELHEIQKALLAMQEQQQKQLELILAIGKAGKLWERKQLSAEDQKSSSNLPKFSAGQETKLDIKQIESLELQKQANIDNA